MSIELNAKILERIEVSPGLAILRVAPDGWQLPEFEAGQFAVLGLPGSAARCDMAMPEEAPAHPEKLIKRAYSIASSSVAQEYLEFYISLVPSGNLTSRLFALHPGDRVWLGRRVRRAHEGRAWPNPSGTVLVVRFRWYWATQLDGTGLCLATEFPSVRDVG